MAEEVFDPIIIRYDGLDAENHQLELNALAQSLHGASKLVGVAAHFVLTGNYVKKAPAQHVRVLAWEFRARCVEIPITVAAFVASAQPYLPLIKGMGRAAVEAIVNFFLARASGRQSDAARAMDVVETAVKETGKTSRAAIDAMRQTVELMADRQRPAARLFVTPVGTSCEVARLGAPEHGAITVDKPTRDAIYAPKETIVTGVNKLRVLVTELDLVNRTCKVSLEGDVDPTRRYLAEIADPALRTGSDNPYSRALQSGAWVTVAAKTTMTGGDIDRLYVSDIVL